MSCTNLGLNDLFNPGLIVAPNDNRPERYMQITLFISLHQIQGGHHPMRPLSPYSSEMDHIDIKKHRYVGPPCVNRSSHNTIYQKWLRSIPKYIHMTHQNKYISFSEWGHSQIIQFINHCEYEAVHFWGSQS